MNLRRSLLGLIAVAMFAVAFSSVGVMSAAASTTEECKIPVEGEEFTSGHFLDENCTKKSGAEGEYHTTLVPETSILKRTKTSPWIEIKTTIAAAPVLITCEEYGGTTTVSNFTEGEKHGFTGKGTIVLSGCVVKEPSACTINKTIETGVLKETSEDLAEVQRTLFTPVEGTKIASFSLSGCALEGTYTIEGKLRSQTVDIHTEEFGTKSGSEAFISKSTPIIFIWWYHDATKANGKTIVRELP